MDYTTLPSKTAVVLDEATFPLVSLYEPTFRS